MTWIILAAAALLAPSNVDVHLAWPDAAPHRNVTIHAHRIDGGAEDADFTSTPIALPAGQWFVTANATGFWSEPRLVTVGAQPAEVTLDLGPATRLHARVKLPRGARASEMTIHLQTIEPRPRTRSVVCTIAGDRAECDAPAGQQDLAFRIAGYASIFRWNETLSPPRADLGTLAFQRGSTFSGRVEMPKDTRVEITLTPFAAAIENEPLRIRKGAAQMVTHPNARGFFAFNVAPGRYVVRASAGELVSDEEEINVIEGREAVLRDTLRLAPKATLTVSVRPPIDPWNKPWRVSIGRSSNNERTITASSDGRALFPALLPGPYIVSVHRGDEDSWAVAQTEVDGDTALDFSIETTRVRGTVTLGGQPLAARITFVGERGTRLPVRSKADGSFLTLLPKIAGDRWPRVEVEAANPRVKRALTDVALSGADSPEATVDIALPSTSLAGMVVDAGGMPQRFALINVTGPGHDFRQIEMSDGAFSMNGAEPGHYQLTAQTREAESEAPVEVDLAEGSTSDVTLVVKPVSRLHGTIRSTFGAVMNAGIFVAPAGVEPPAISLLPVNADGRFDVRLPPHTEEAVVAAAAPGFAFRILRVPVTTSDADIAVDQQGGTLVIDAGDDHPVVMHNGAALSANIVAYLAGARRVDAKSFEIAQAEAGTYSLCSSGDQCVSGTLARGGRLVLTARATGRAAPESTAASP